MTWALRNAGISTEVINSGMSAFILEILARKGKTAPRLCYEDPRILMYGGDMLKIFPNSKFIFVIRKVHFECSQGGFYRIFKYNLASVGPNPKIPNSEP